MEVRIVIQRNQIKICLHGLLVRFLVAIPALPMSNSISWEIQLRIHHVRMLCHRRLFSIVDGLQLRSDKLNNEADITLHMYQSTVKLRKQHHQTIWSNLDALVNYDQKQ